MCSYTTPAQRALFAILRKRHDADPDHRAHAADACAACDLRFSSYAVLDYGGMVLQPGGAVDRTGWSRMRTAMHAALPGLQELAAFIDGLGARTGYGGRARMIEDFGTPFFLVVKDPDKVAGRLAPIERDVVRPGSWTKARDYWSTATATTWRSCRARSTRRMPWPTSPHACAREHGEIVTFGMGDSRSDARFMADCDYAIVPRGTQLAA
jgi:hypothetical protein